MDRQVRIFSYCAANKKESTMIGRNCLELTLSSRSRSSMAHPDHRWALVLAGGDGRRLQHLTRTVTGAIVPKQYCSLNGGLSFLEETVRRAEAVVSRERIYAIVANAHRRHWSRHLDSLPQRNIIAQPSNKGTAIGILLPLLHILARDADARVVLLPSDHHVRNEARLAASLRAALSADNASGADIVLLGIEPREPDPALGYIVPRGQHSAEYAAVDCFVEKPSRAEAEKLIGRGALWNSFIIAADGAALLRLFERQCPDIVSEMHQLVQRETRGEPVGEALSTLYDRLPNLDFSRGILQGQEGSLSMLAVPECGWSDLGTPERVAEALRDLPTFTEVAARMSHSRAAVNLATQQELLRARPAKTACGHAL
jgi:mannose-1-phosphate guanylyltransferase